MDLPSPHPAARAPQNPEPHSPVSTSSSYFTLPQQSLADVTGADVTARDKMDFVRTWSQDLDLFSLPETDEEGNPDADSGADSGADSAGKSSGSSDATPPASADGSAAGSADFSTHVGADVGAEVSSVTSVLLPGRLAGGEPLNSRSLSTAGEPGKTLPVENGCDLRPETQSEKVVGAQVPSPTSASVKQWLSTNPAPKPPPTPSSTKGRPVKSVDALIGRVLLAVNEAKPAVPKTDPLLAPQRRSPLKARRAISPSPRRLYLQLTDTKDNPESPALVRSPSALRPSYGRFSDGDRTDDVPSPHGYATFERKRLGRRYSIDGRSSNDSRTGDGPSLDRRWTFDGPWSGDGQFTNDRRTVAQVSPRGLWTLDEKRPDLPWTGDGQSPGARRCADGPLLEGRWTFEGKRSDRPWTADRQSADGCWKGDSDLPSPNGLGSFEQERSDRPWTADGQLADGRRMARRPSLDGLRLFEGKRMDRPWTAGGESAGGRRTIAQPLSNGRWSFDERRPDRPWTGDGTGPGRPPEFRRAVPFPVPRPRRRCDGRTPDVHRKASDVGKDPDAMRRAERGWTGGVGSANSRSKLRSRSSVRGGGIRNGLRNGLTWWRERRRSASGENVTWAPRFDNVFSSADLITWNVENENSLNN